MSDSSPLEWAARSPRRVAHGFVLAVRDARNGGSPRAFLVPPPRRVRRGLSQVRRRGVVPRHVGRHDVGDDAAVLGPDTVALPPACQQDRGDAPGCADRPCERGVLLRLEPCFPATPPLSPEYGDRDHCRQELEALESHERIDSWLESPTRKPVDQSRLATLDSLLGGAANSRK